MTVDVEAKELGNTNVDEAKKNIGDLVVFGDGDMFKLLCKASSKKQGFMKSTKAMEIKGVGCVVQISTQQKNPDGSYALAEACCFVPNVRIAEFSGDCIEECGQSKTPITSRQLVGCIS